MILNKTAYYFNEPKRFDIVVVDMPDEYLIKRVIGLPGEHIEYKDNTLYVILFEIIVIILLAYILKKKNSIIKKRQVINKL